MSTPTWTRAEIINYAALHGLKLDTTEEIDRVIMLATRVASVASSIKRMPSKAHEPASIFKVLP